MELNDKLKAVHLLRALGVEDSMKRDILSKVDFGKRPKEVFESILELGIPYLRQIGLQRRKRIGNKSKQ